MLQPPTGWTTPAKIIDVIDGDTLRVLVERKLIVRLLHCYAAETRTTNLKEKRRGELAKQYMQAMLPLGHPVTVHIPANTIDFSDLLTLNRVLGRVWSDGRDLSEEMVAAGHATATKD